MSLRFGMRNKPQVRWNGSRLRRAQERVSDSAQKAAEAIGPAASQARDVASERMTDAREWSAPRLEQAAQYVEKELGPKVGELLHRTAGKVEPPRPRRRRRGIATAMLVMAGAIGAVGVAMSRRTMSRSEGPSQSSPADLSSVSENNSAQRARSS